MRKIRLYRRKDVRKQKQRRKAKKMRRNKKKRAHLSVFEEGKFKKYGDYAEWIAEQILKELVQEKRIKEYRKHDRAGIDYDIYLFNHSTAYWQIKSNERGCQNHRKKYPHIPCSSFDRRTQHEDENQHEFEKRLIKRGKHDVIQLFRL